MNGRVLIQQDKEFINYLKKTGGEDLKKCFQCANCTSVCQLSTEENAFPRRQMLLAQWGLKDRLLEDPGPWLCFYCGDCSARCPRSGNPGETMMNLRRYLTSLYDWTGLSRLMYQSVFWEIGVLAFVAAIMVLLFTIPNDFGFGLLMHQSDPAAFSKVMLERFAPVGIVDWGDRIMAVVLGFLLLSNAARMFRGLTRRDKIPISFYIMQFPRLIVQFLTQKRWKDCNSNESTLNWVRHLFLVSGYVIMFTLVVVFLPWFQIKDSSIHWTSILGYYSTLVLLVSTLWMIFDRMKKRTEMHKFSHFSDWLFPILLFFTALSGIVLHIFRIMDLAMPTYYAYMIHLVILVPMLIVEVPFGKWSHLLYRPLAIYITAVKKKARELQEQENVASNQATVSI